VAEKYEKQKQLLMEAIKKKEAAAALVPVAAGHHRDRRFSEVGHGPNISGQKFDRRHSDLTAYYYQHQVSVLRNDFFGLKSF
jgi:hypothetical protein